MSDYYSDEEYLSDEDHFDEYWNDRIPNFHDLYSDFVRVVIKPEPYPEPEPRNPCLKPDPEPDPEPACDSLVEHFYDYSHDNSSDDYYYHEEFDYEDIRPAFCWHPHINANYYLSQIYR